MSLVKKKIVIFHGLGGHSGENWFPWAGEKLRALGHKVIIPDLPQADEPSNKDWVNTAKQEVGSFDQNTFLIGHSLGGSLILYLLASLTKETPVAGALVIAAPLTDLGWPLLRRFFLKPIDLEAVKGKARKLWLLYSTDDPHVPVNQAKTLHLALPDSRLTIVASQGHFNTLKNQLVWEQIEQLVTGNP